MITSICVFCGSSSGNLDIYRQAAVSLGETLSRAGIDLVYGGSNIGLMGTVARTMLEHGRKVTGIIPKALHSVVDPLEVSELIVVDTMHERKASMYERSDAFIALPGGIGTFEELLETYTWSQLGYLQKPVGILNTNGYYDLLIKQLAHSVSSGFMKQSHFDELIVSDTPKDLLRSMEDYSYAYKPKWI